MVSQYCKAQVMNKYFLHTSLAYTNYIKKQCNRSFIMLITINKYYFISLRWQWNSVLFFPSFSISSQKLALHSSMDCATVTGGDVAPMGSNGVTATRCLSEPTPAGEGEALYCAPLTINELDHANQLLNTDSWIGLNMIDCYSGICGNGMGFIYLFIFLLAN